MLNSVFSRKREEDEFRQEGRLPPGQSLTQKFPVLHYGRIPKVDLSTWDLRVWGAVEEEIRWTWDEFNQLPKTEIVMDLHCVTKWSKFNTRWQGVSMKTLVDEGFIKPRPGAKFVVQHAEFGYTTNLPLDVILQDNFLLATHYDGHPIPLDHGYPLRGVVGHITGRDDLMDPYLWKGAKWLRGLEFSAQDQPGFWEQAGYHNRGDVWKEERTR